MLVRRRRAQTPRRWAEPRTPAHGTLLRGIDAFTEEVRSGQIQRQLEAHPEQRLTILGHLHRKRLAHRIAGVITRGLGPEAAARVDREQREMRQLERLARRSAGRAHLARAPLARAPLAPPLPHRGLDA
jgi:hypothetical protein